MFAVQWGVGTWVYPAINPLKAPLAFAREAQAKVPPGRPLLLYSIDGEILSFYADRPGRVYEDVPSIEAAMREEARGLAVFEEDDWASVRDLLTVSGDAHPFRMGGKRLVRFDYDTGAPGSSDQDRRPTGHE